MLKFKDQDFKANVSLATVETYLRKLRLSKDLASDQELLTIFQTINRYLQDEDAVFKFLYLLPNSREGLVCVAQGLFSCIEEVERLTTEILRKLESTTVGKHAMSQLNYFFMLKYQKNLICAK